ncbi:MAG: methyl-accepting chemotaxis protein, partial [Treponema sp.]|nr:methyl-accepting chemotaxis protein [Treponema sp.]
MAYPYNASYNRSIEGNTMKFSIKLTLINTFIMITLIAAIASVVLVRAAHLQREAALKQLTTLSDSIAKDITTQSVNCMDILTGIILTACYDQHTPLEMRRTSLQNALGTLLAAVPQFISVYTVWLPDAFDGMDAAYIGTPGATESGQFAVLISRTSSSAMEVKTYEGYQAVLANMTTANFVSNPALYTVNGEPTYLLDIQVPVMFGREKASGLLGLQVGLEGAQAIAEQEKPYGTGYVALYANNGTVVSHNDPAKIGKNFRDVDTELLGTIGVSAVAESITDYKSAAFTHNDMAIAICPFKSKGTNDTWTVVSVVPLDTVLAPVHSLIGFSVVFLIIAGLVAAIAIFLTSNNLARRIIRVRDMVKNIAEGEGDLTRRLTIYAQDEIGSMGTYFNETLDKIHSMMWTVKDRSTNLAMIGAELSANMTETAATVNEIATTIQQVHKQVNNQAGSVSQTDKTMQKIAASIEQLNTHLETQAESVNQCSVAIEEMLANIASVTQTLIKNDENVKKLSQASEAGRTGLEEVSIDIQEIAKESQGLLEITAVLENIASQT